MTPSKVARELLYKINRGDSEIGLEAEIALALTQAISQEREACAKVADIACVYCGMDKSKCSVGGRNHVRAPLIATAIRKRGEVG